MVMEAPEVSVLTPVLSSAEPAAPDAALPVASARDPLLPKLLEPEDTAMRPLAPLEPALADVIDTLPDDE